MDFTFSEEQILLRDTVERFVRDELPFETRQTIIDSPNRYREDHWQRLAELGVLALPISEDRGGLGGGGIETLLVMEQLGRSLMPAPFLSCILLGAALLDRLGANDEHTAVLEQVMAGEKKLAFAYAEQGARYTIENVATSANRSGKGFSLKGKKTTVFNAHTADYIIVLTRTSGEQMDRQGLSLFVIPSDSEGVTIESYPTQDGSVASEITLNNVQVEAAALLGEEGKAFTPVEATIDNATAALCAEASGIMWAIYDLTLEYMKTRKQFGQTLGSFQVLQHRMVDMYMMCQMAQSMSYEAVNALDLSSLDRCKAISAAKSLIGRYGRKVGQEGIQLHGGMGMTLEYAIGHYFKRLCMIDATFGDVSWHTNRYAKTL